MENHKSYFYIIYEMNLHNKEKERKNENQKNYSIIVNGSDDVHPYCMRGRF